MIFLPYVLPLNYILNSRNSPGIRINHTILSENQIICFPLACCLYMSIVSASRNIQLQTAPQKRNRLKQNIWFTFDSMEERKNYSNHINFGYGLQYDVAVAVAFLVLSVFGKGFNIKYKTNFKRLDHFVQS